jgi:hypothetical protein
MCNHSPNQPHSLECYSSRAADAARLGLDFNKLYPNIFKVSDIPYRIQYRKSSRSRNRFRENLDDNLHKGQRKLADSEIQFLSTYLQSHTEHCVVIYVGSSPNNKLGILMDLFPNITFLLVDPHEALIFTDDKRTPHYADTTERFVYLSYTNADESGYHGEREINYYNPHNNCADYPSDPQNEDSCADYDSHSENYIIRRNKMINPETEISQQAIDAVFESQPRCFIAESYFDQDLALKIRSAMGRYSNRVLFISDIRTCGACDVSPDGMPTNSDAIWNLLQMYNWVRAICPDVSMLKFRLPYFDVSPSKYGNISPSSNVADNSATFEDIAWNHPLIQAELALAIEPIGDIAGFDFRKHFEETHSFAYFSNIDLMLQAHAGKSSTETRAIVPIQSLSLPLIGYDSVEYEEKLQFYNKIFRVGLRSHNPLYALNPNACRRVGIDRCGDCAIEADAIRRYCRLNRDINPFAIVHRLNVCLKPLSGRGMSHGYL